MEFTRRFRLFLASPSDTREEREQASRVVGEVNDALRDRQIEFELLQWEAWPGSATRPQEAINELVDQSDFMVCILKESWGSDPGGGIYSSGSEEELFTALLGLSNPSHPMRDVWISFLRYESVNPCAEIKDLEQQIIQSNAMLFEKSNSEDDFSQRLQRRLLGWANAKQTKEARTVSLKPRSGRDVVGASHFRSRGSMLADLGHPDQAADAFLEAVRLGGSAEKLAYAQFLGRQSRIAEAIEMAEDAINDLVSGPHLRPASIAEAVVVKASLERRNGDLTASAASLRSALPRLTGLDPDVVGSRARINDELGVVLHQQSLKARGRGDQSMFLSDSSAALSTLTRALKDRELVDDVPAIAQSKINIGRVLVAQQRAEEAIQYQSEAIETLESIAGQSLANAYLARAQALLAAAGTRIGATGENESGTHRQLERAQVDAEHALATNTQLKNRRGQAMALNVIAQIQDGKGSRTEAQTAARRCVAINDELGMSPPRIVRTLAGDGG